MYYVTDGLYCLSNQVIWQGSPFISIMQALAVDSDDFVALSTSISNVGMLEAESAAHVVVSLFLRGSYRGALLLSSSSIECVQQYE